MAGTPLALVSATAMDRPRRRVRRLRWPSVATQVILSLGAGATSVTAMSSWVLLTDPAVAADVAAAGDLMPLMAALVETLRSTIADLLAYL
jgi:hypothetical protein